MSTSTKPKHNPLWFRMVSTMTILVMLAILSACSGTPSRAGTSAIPRSPSVKDGSAAGYGEASSIPAPPGSPAPVPAPLTAPTARETGAKLASPTAVRTPPSESGLKAGYSDDNVQFNYYLEFLQTYKRTRHWPYDITERLNLRVLDMHGKPVPNARIMVQDGNTQLASGLSHPDGTFRFYPAALGTPATDFLVSVIAGDLSNELVIARHGPRNNDIILPGLRRLPDMVPLDVLFIMDTTGSMGEEIQRLKSTIEIIHLNLSALKPRPLLRFGLVLYKDRGDSYITRNIPFTTDLNSFQLVLDSVKAAGGGDYPEDLESALDEAVNAMDWNLDGVRIGFIITDAPAHLDYGRTYTYIDAANDARKLAIKLYGIGTGGLTLDGEYQLRQIAQLTDASYIFLTYGEQGESEGGRDQSVSHHTGANWQAEKLEAIIIRFVREEVSHLSDTPLALDESYFSATSVHDETTEQTLDKLFTETLGNLIDYASYRVAADTPCAILPITATGADLVPLAEYFSERLSLAAAGVRRFRLVERRDMQRLLEELELQLSGLVDAAMAARVGDFLGAEVLVSGTLYRRADGFELFLKLMKVSTAEILSITRARVDLSLGF